MFDPHCTRRSNSRYFTRKGQVLQASLVNTKPVIDQRLVPIYKNYLIKNNYLTVPPPPPPPPPTPPTIKPLGIIVMYYEDDPRSFPFEDMTLITEETSIIKVAGSKSQPKAFMLFSQQKDGSIKFITTVVDYSYNYSLVNNAKCYYTVFNESNGEVFLESTKLLYHTEPLQRYAFLTMDCDTNIHDRCQMLYIKTPFNIVL